MKATNVTGDSANLANERSAIRDELRKMKDFPALEGAISFGKNGDALKPAYVIEMNDAKWNLIASYPPNS
jgi:branched-chain amino acid transport system substrate-binding protein